MLDHSRSGPDNSRTEEIQCCIDQGCQHRQRARKHDNSDFTYQQDGVRDQVDIDSNLHNPVTTLHAIILHTRNFGFWSFMLLVVRSILESQKRSGVIRNLIDFAWCPLYFLAQSSVQVLSKTGTGFSSFEALRSGLLCDGWRYFNIPRM